MHRLLNGLQIPECYICCHRTYVTGMEALTILLQRLSYPSRWCDLEAIFGRSESELSLFFYKVFNLFYRTCQIKKLSGFSKYPPLCLTSVVSSTFSFAQSQKKRLLNYESIGLSSQTTMCNTSIIVKYTYNFDFRGT